MKRWTSLVGAAALILGLASVGPTREVEKAAEGSPSPEVPLLLQKPTMNKSHIVFTYADDLWTVPRAGGEARRLTSAPGVETDPTFSPDGTTVAFTGQYDGNEDVYTVPAGGGEPKRLTYHPGADQAVGWTPDGKRVVFRSGRASHSRFTKLFSVGLDGGLPEELPLPMADSGSLSADGKRLAYVPFVNHPRGPGANVAWKKYRGGKQPKVWIADLADSSVVKVPSKGSNDTNPMWLDGRLYFLSDRDGPVTLFEYDAAAREARKLFDNKGFDVRSASAGPDAIVYEKPGGLFIHDVKANRSRKVPVTIKAELPDARPRFVALAGAVHKAALSPTGARAVFEARGEILTVPARKGDVRNLTKTPGVAERDPAWSPDGKSIAYFSDESGEYMLHVRPHNGRGAVRKLAPGDGASFFYNPAWSPDSRSIAYTDKRMNFWVSDVASGKATRIDTNKYNDFPRVTTPAWSPDGKWLAYARQLDSHLFAVFLHSLATGKSHQVTDGMSDARDPQFDRSGKYLFFTASTNVGPTRGMFMSSLNRPSSRDVYLVVLSNQEKSPLAPESDEEGEARPAAKGPDRKAAAGAAAAAAAPQGCRVDVEDIDQRILHVPVPTRNYVALLAGKAGSLFLVEAPEFVWVGPTSRASAGPRLSLHRFDLKARKADKVLEGVSGLTLSADGEKMLYSQGDSPQTTRWCIAATAGAVQPGAGALRLESMQVKVDPRAEWRQMFRETWRIQRDFLYDPRAHGYDLEAAARRYEPFLAGVASRNDLSYLFDEMLGGLALGHVYIQGGDRPRVPSGPRNGLLGADFTIENGKYRFARVYRGENWNPELRAPLTQPGARVREGEYLLAVDGTPLGAGDNVYRLLEGRGGRSVTLRVSAKPDGGGARDVEVTPTPSEQALRHHAWVEDNRRLVDKKSGGKVAYIYLPNTHGAGHDRFVREFYAQIGKDGVIVDERFNGGGYLADEVIDALSQKPRNYVTTREGADQVHPRGIFGAKAMIINEFAGSGGDYLPYTFRQAKLGPLVGKRTWGGLVGIGGYPPLIDGGGVTAPHLGIWFPNGKWDVENAGVAPDVEVEFDPRAARAGRDPQLDRALELVLAELKKNPVKRPKRPAFPDYYGPDRASSRR